MAEIPVLERLTASDLFLLQWDDSGWSSDIGGLSQLDPHGACVCDHR
jgi:diacylglycerol O-acyltransferase